jgi:Yip1 domain
VYGLGRAFGGTGQFGELAWGLSLFSSPLAVVSTIVAVIPFVGGIAAFALSLYGLYLTYLAIQSGMNLPSQKALYVILVLFLIFLGLFCFVFGAALLAIIGLGAAGSVSP